MQAPFCFLQAGALRSQPSVPVIALTGDTKVCAFLKRLASEKMLLDQQRLCTGLHDAECHKRTSIRALNFVMMTRGEVYS